MADDLSLEPSAYDAHGGAIYPDDLLDLRWEALQHDVDSDRFDLESGVHSLLFSDDVDLIRRGVEVITLLAERHIMRLAHPGLLDEESGQAWWRRQVVADLRAKRDEYDRVRERLGWPADLDDLDDDQLGTATLIVRHPELIDEIARYH